jgi:hypothetical protein
VVVDTVVGQAERLRLAMTSAVADAVVDMAADTVVGTIVGWLERSPVVVAVTASAVADTIVVHSARARHTCYKMHSPPQAVCHIGGKPPSECFANQLCLRRREPEIRENRACYQTCSPSLIAVESVMTAPMMAALLITDTFPSKTGYVIDSSCSSHYCLTRRYQKVYLLIGMFLTSYSGRNHVFAPQSGNLHTRIRLHVLILWYHQCAIKR